MQSDEPTEPAQLDYATPTPDPRRVQPSSIIAWAAAVVALVGFGMPPIVGSMRLAENRLWVLTWLVFYGLVIAYVWQRLRETRPGWDVGRTMTGIATTFALIALAAMLLQWKPNWPMLIGACAAFLCIAMLGRWMTGRT